MRKFLLLLYAVVLSFAATAQQNLWTPANESSLGKNVFEKKIRPSKFHLFSLNEKAMEANLKNAPSEKQVSVKASSFIITIPNENGQPEQFRVVEASVMHPLLAAKHPRIRSFTGKSLTDPTTVIRFSMTPEGFKGMVLSAKKSTVYIESVDRKQQVYSVVAKSELPSLPAYKCLTKSISFARPNSQQNNLVIENANDQVLYTFDLALAASGEFSEFWENELGLAGDITKAQVLARMVEHVTRVNGIMERDFGVRLLLVADEEEIIYLDPATDPWNSGNPDDGHLCPATQGDIDAKIGDADYDIGHLLRVGDDYGNACSVGNACITGSKGGAFTSRSSWASGNGFDEYIFAHELGHQVGAGHTFTHSDDNDNAQMEPGSGSTIMSYAGLTGASTDIQGLMDDYFHAISIQQTTAYILTTGTCRTDNAIGNNAPTADAGASFTIPKSTPFKLNGSGTDADGDALTFTWEQMDKLTAPGDFPRIPAATQTNGPEFRSVYPSTSTLRYMPTFANILDGSNTNKWEKLPSVARTLNFRFTVRDNNPGAGQNNSDDMVVTVAGDIGPFKVTSPNSAVTWCPGTQTVTWDVNGSAALAANVKISISTNGGTSFSTLVSSTANDGSANVTIPCAFSSQARIKIEAIDNIFLDISDVNFSVGDNTKPTFDVPVNVIIYKDANCNYNVIPSITGDATNEADNCDNTIGNATSSDVITVGSCADETKITRTWTLTDACGNKTQKIQIITIKDNTAPTFTVPLAITIYKDANCNYNALPSITGDATNEADNCDNTIGNATYNDAIAVGACADESKITRTWTLTDACSNTTQKIQIITVKDNTAPTFTVPPAITIYKDANCNHNDDPSKTGNVTNAADNCDATPTVTYADVDAPGSCMGEVIITRTWKVVDNCSNAIEKIQVITVKDTTAPIITNVNANPASLWPPNHKMRDVTINYNVTDNCSDAAHITNVLTIKSNEPLNGTGDGDTDIDYEVIDEHHVKLRAERAGNGNGRIYTITITSTDDCGNVKMDSVKVYVVHNITGPNAGNAVKIGSTVTMSGVFWNVPGGTHTAKWVLDEATNVNAVVTEPSGNNNGKVTGSYNFTAAGVYRVRMDVTRNGITSYATTNGDQEQIIVVYDPNGGHTYGGGWFSSTAGSLKTNLTATGKASFGFAANYFKKSTLPKGETEFVFKVGDFEFNAINFEYLSIAGVKAQIKGSGKIKGLQSGINFIMTVLDGATNGTPDKIRMKIFNKNSGQVYYDNQTGASDADDPATAVGNNSVIFVSGSNTLQRNGEETIITEEVAGKISVKAFPNPSNTYFRVAINSSSNEKITMRVFDLYGRKLEEKIVNNGEVVKFGEAYHSGVYFVSIQQGTYRNDLKLIKLKE